MGLQRVDTDATEAIEIIRKEGLSLPVRAPCLSDSVRKDLELSIQMFVIVGEPLCITQYTGQ